MELAPERVIMGIEGREGHARAAGAPLSAGLVAVPGHSEKLRSCTWRGQLAMPIAGNRRAEICKPVHIPQVGAMGEGGWWHEACLASGNVDSASCTVGIWEVTV
jgi:hypothetical protein